MLLSSGSVVYFGAADAMLGHLALAGYPCNTFVNPLDHAIDTVVVDRRTAVTEAATTKRLRQLVALYEASPAAKDLRRTLDDTAEEALRCADARAPSPPAVSVAAALARWFYTFSTVLGRQWTNLARTPYVRVLPAEMIAPHPRPLRSPWVATNLTHTCLDSSSPCAPTRGGGGGGGGASLAGSRCSCVWASRLRLHAYCRLLCCSWTITRCVPMFFFLPPSAVLGENSSQLSDSIRG